MQSLVLSEQLFQSCVVEIHHAQPERYYKQLLDPQCAFTGELPPEDEPPASCGPEGLAIDDSGLCLDHVPDARPSSKHFPGSRSVLDALPVSSVPHRRHHAHDLMSLESESFEEVAVSDNDPEAAVTESEPDMHDPSSMPTEALELEEYSPDLDDDNAAQVPVPAKFRHELECLQRGRGPQPSDPDVVMESPAADCFTDVLHEMGSENFASDAVAVKGSEALDVPLIELLGEAKVHLPNPPSPQVSKPSQVHPPHPPEVSQAAATETSPSAVLEDLAVGLEAAAAAAADATDAAGATEALPASATDLMHAPPPAVPPQPAGSHSDHQRNILRAPERHPDSFSWGAFRFTFSGPETRPPFGAWQAKCKYHKLNSKTWCTRAVNIGESVASKDKVLRLLKMWCLSACRHQRKDSHACEPLVSCDLPDEVLDAKLQELPEPPGTALVPDDEQPPASSAADAARPADALQGRGRKRQHSSRTAHAESAAPKAKSKAKAKAKLKAKAKARKKARVKPKAKSRAATAAKAAASAVASDEAASDPPSDNDPDADRLSTDTSDSSSSDSSSDSSSSSSSASSS